MESNYSIPLEVTIQNDRVEINGHTSLSLFRIMPHGEISYYEKLAKPRMIKDSSQVNFSQKQIDRVIKEIFKCSMCLQIFNEPVNHKNCLHKYCQKCIEDYLRRIKKECIFCRHPIETKRSLRRDLKIKSIISCFIKDTELFQQDEEKMLEQSVIEISAIQKEKRIQLKNKSHFLNKPNHTRAKANKDIFQSHDFSKDDCIKDYRDEKIGFQKELLYKNKQVSFEYQNKFQYLRKKHKPEPNNESDSVKEVQMLNNAKSVRIKLIPEQDELKSKFVTVRLLMNKYD